MNRANWTGPHASGSRTEVATPSFRAHARAMPLLLVAFLVACCPAPGGVSTETSFAARIDSLTAPLAVATLDDGSMVRLSLDEQSLPAALAEGSRVYVEGVFSGDLVVVRRILLL